MHKGNIFVISAPSGAGKSSLVNAVCKLDAQIQVSISHTTRNRRHNEQEGVNYYFITQSEFLIMLEKHEFLEYAKVYDNYYGTNKNTINQFLASGKDIILEIDWQGARQIKQLIPEAIFIYIMPPCLQVLEHRLRSRNTDSDEVVQKRLALAKNDISHASHFDYIIINDNFDDAVHDLYSIIGVQRLKSKNVLADLNFS